MYILLFNVYSKQLAKYTSQAKGNNSNEPRKPSLLQNHETTLVCKPGQTRNILAVILCLEPGWDCLSTDMGVSTNE